MAQLSSNTLVYDQVYFRIKDFILKDTQNEYKTLEEKTEAYNKLLHDIYRSVDEPISTFDPFIKGEPPISQKANRYAAKYADDLNILSKQIDYLTAKTVSIFNLFFNEIENEKRYIERISSKAKILQMYAKSPSNDIVYYGDTFDNMDRVDVSLIRSRHMPDISDGTASLPIEKARVVRPKKIYINRQDGFLGNNHQIIKSLNSEGSSEYKYVFEDVPVIGSLTSLSDNNPLTYMEFEALQVDKRSGSTGELPSDAEFTYINKDSVASNSNQIKLIDWSSYDVSNPLKVSVVMETDAAMTNAINIVPYFGSSKILKVTQVKMTKKDGSTVEILSKPIYIGSSFIPSNLEVAKSYHYNKAILRFAEMETIQAEVFFEQSNHEAIEIGHNYWKTDYTTAVPSSPFYGTTRFSPDSLNRELYEEIEYDKYAILPESSRPNKFKKEGATSKSISIRLKTKSRSYEFWTITLNVDKKVEAVDTGKKKAYFHKWIVSISNPAGGFTFADQVSFANGALNIKTYTNETEAQSDLSALQALVASQPNNEFTVENVVYKVTDVGLEKLTYQDQGSSTSYSVPIISQRERYNARRMAIGIRDITLMHESYANQAEIVSTPYQFDAPVESLMLSVDSNVDNTFADKIDVSYYISVESGKWIQISPVQLDNRGIAEVLVFNKNISESSKLPGVAYLSYPQVPKDIKQVVVKIVYTKDRNTNITPSIYSYELIAKVVS